MKTVFIYALKEPDTGEIRYVGKTVNLRKRFRKHLNQSRFENHHRANWIKSLLIRGLEPILETLDEVSEDFWPQWEVAYIEFFRESGNRLVNDNYGGEGSHNPSEETRKKLSTLNSGANHPMFGKKRPPRSLEWREKLAAARRGKPNRVTWGDKISEAKMGHIVSLETRRKISESLRGNIPWNKGKVSNVF